MCVFLSLVDTHGFSAGIFVEKWGANLCDKCASATPAHCQSVSTLPYYHCEIEKPQSITYGGTAAIYRSRVPVSITSDIILVI